jgi:hypothetical protein
MTTQLAIDIASSSAPTSRVTESPWLNSSTRLMLMPQGS